MMKRQVAVLAVAAAAVVSVTAAMAVTATGQDGSHAHHGSEGSSHHHAGDGHAHDRHDHGADDEYSYLAEMIVHHEEAVAAAEVLKRSERAEMRELGEAVISSQTAQIEQMEQWLADWYPDRSGEYDGYEPMMRDLAGLEGDRLDRVFLEDMVDHHMGAVMLSQQLLVDGAADHEEVEELAESIRDEQHAEISQMQQWLRDWFGVTLQHDETGGMGGMHG